MKLYLHAVLLGTLLSILTVFNAFSQDFVFDGYRGCTRATNGKAYCQRPGNDTYFPVSDQFLQRFEAQRDATAARPQTVINNTTTNVVVVQRLENEASDLRGLMDLYRVIIQEQRQEAVDSTCGSVSGVAQEAITALNARVAEVQGQFRERTTELSQYTTSIKPNDPDLQITARKSSELFPKIPYTIPGSTEQGDFWLEPNVTDAGELSFNLKFIDPKSTAVDKIRTSITMSPQELNQTRTALCKSAQWSRTAHENRVRGIKKRLTCFPEIKCPAENEKREGAASAEIIFAVGDDGSTGALIQRNRGRYQDAYLISIGSAMLLQTYLGHILYQGKQEFESGTRTQDQVRDLFK